MRCVEMDNGIPLMVLCSKNGYELVLCLPGFDAFGTGDASPGFKSSFWMLPCSGLMAMPRIRDFMAGRRLVTAHSSPIPSFVLSLH